MPIHEIRCRDCGHQGETLTLSAAETPRCPACGGDNLERALSAPSSLTGREAKRFPGPADRGCCGSTPAQAAAGGCAGPGSCCGRNGG